MVCKVRIETHARAGDGISPSAEMEMSITYASATGRLVMKPKRNVDKPAMAAVAVMKSRLVSVNCLAEITEGVYCCGTYPVNINCSRYWSYTSGLWGQNRRKFLQSP